MSGQHHWPGKHSSGSWQRGAERPSPQWAEAGFLPPDRAAKRPPKKASAAEPFLPVPHQTQWQTFSWSCRGTSCASTRRCYWVGATGSNDVKCQRGEWRHGFNWYLCRCLSENHWTFNWVILNVAKTHRNSTYLTVKKTFEFNVKEF